MSGFAAPTLAQGATRLKMVLNWTCQGPQAWFFLAQDKGYFTDAADRALCPPIDPSRPHPERPATR